MFKQVSCAIAATAAGTLIAGMPGHAQVTYSQDSIFDGEGEVNPNDGVSAFELFGTGYVQDGNHLIVGISSRLPLGGVPIDSAPNSPVAWGDMFFNFDPDKTFNEALGDANDPNDGSVYGVRFTEANDGALGLGLYKVNTVDSVSIDNQGFSNLNSYRNTASRPTLGDVFNLTNSNSVDLTGNGDVVDFGANYSDFDYLPKGGNHNNTQSLIAADSEFLGDVAVLDETQLAGYGFDFANNIKTRGNDVKTYGFKFDVSKLPGGNFIAHLWAECFNEGTAFEGEVASVPEPTLALALAVVGGVAWARKRKGSNA